LFLLYFLFIGGESINLVHESMMPAFLTKQLQHVQYYQFNLSKIKLFFLKEILSIVKKITPLTISFSLICAKFLIDYSSPSLTFLSNLSSPLFSLFFSFSLMALCWCSLWLWFKKHSNPKSLVVVLPVQGNLPFYLYFLPINWILLLIFV